MFRGGHRFVRVLTAAVSLWICGCSSSDSGSGTDPSEVPVRVVSVVKLDANNGDRPVATFKFEQFEDGRIQLRLEGIIPESFESVSFTYEVAFTPRQVSDTVIPWKSQGAVINLVAGQTADQGVIATSPAPIDDGKFTITFLTNPDYKQAS